MILRIFLHRDFLSPLALAPRRSSHSQIWSRCEIVMHSKHWINPSQNYRSHPVLLMPPSAMFYNDTLQPCATNGYIVWSQMADPRLPFMFINNEGNEASDDERATWYNESEINRIVSTIQSLMSEASKCFPPLKASEIGVMAPWRQQVWKLRERLRAARLNAVDVGTVEVCSV
jgi:superfamily I DNA and/or RNA helicase